MCQVFLEGVVDVAREKTGNSITVPHQGVKGCFQRHFKKVGTAWP